MRKPFLYNNNIVLSWTFFSFIKIFILIVLCEKNFEIEVLLNVGN